MAFGHDVGMVVVFLGDGTRYSRTSQFWFGGLVKANRGPRFCRAASGAYGHDCRHVPGFGRYASLPDVQRIVVSVVLGTASVATLMWLAGKIPPPGFAEFFVQSLLLTFA